MIPVSVRGVGNPVTFGWVPLVVAAVVLLRSRVSMAFSAATWWQSPRALVAAVSVAVALLTPLPVSSVKLWSEVAMSRSIKSGGARPGASMPPRSSLAIRSAAGGASGSAVSMRGWT